MGVRLLLSLQGQAFLGLDKLGRLSSCAALDQPLQRAAGVVRWLRRASELYISWDAGFAVQKAPLPWKVFIRTEINLIKAGQGV